MGSPAKRIAIVGGGFAGMCSVWSLLEEGGFEPVCFEKTDKPGGLWCYREDSSVGIPSIMPTTIINHSKEMGALSNHPPSKEMNNFLRHKELYHHAIDVARSKGALEYIQCNSDVTRVARAGDYEASGRWSVTVRNTISGVESTDIYDGVLVCVGHFNRPKIPNYSGQELFKGPIIHTHSLKGVEQFKDKTVAVVGMGCSGLDAAVESSRIAKQVYLSTRSGAHVFQRVGFNGYPYDYTLLRRWLYVFLHLLPTHAVSWLVESVFMSPRFNPNMYAVRPRHHVFSRDPVVNDLLASTLLSGVVKQVRDIQRFTEDGVVFEGDKEVTKVDAVVMATGYTWKFPFLEEGIVYREDDGKFNLYKLMYPVDLPHATLAIIAFALPFGPGFPIGELQLRWATQILAGNCKLPSKKVMREDIRKRHEKNLARYTPHEKMSLRVDFVPFCDEIASQFGARPNFLKMFLTDPKLFFKLVFGPSLSYQYRLQGPHAWEGAREAIMTCESRVLYPLTKGQPEKIREPMFAVIFKKVFNFLFH